MAVLWNIMAAALGAGGWATASKLGFDIRQARAKREQEIMDYLGDMRLRLSNKPELLHVVEQLRAESSARQAGAAFEDSAFDSFSMRSLPAFLEPIGIFLKYQSSVSRRAYEAFAEEVLLCHRSKALWKGDGYSGTYWSDFKEFARMTEARLQGVNVRA